MTREWKMCRASSQGHHYKNKKGKLVFWWGHLGNIWFSESNFMKSKNHLLIWKVIYFSCTLSRLAFLCRDCPFGYPGQQHPKAMLARAKTEPLKNSKIKIWSSQKNTLADGSFFPFSHSIPISLIFLHFVTEAKQRTVYSFKKFLSF